MASKSKLKKMAAMNREREHEQVRMLKEKSKELKQLGVHPDQIIKRDQERAADYYYQRRRKKIELRPVIQTEVYRRETPTYPSVMMIGGQLTTI